MIYLCISNYESYFRNGTWHKFSYKRWNLMLSMFCFLAYFLLQIILCSAVKLFRKGKKDTTIGEVYFQPPVNVINIERFMWLIFLRFVFMWMQLNKSYLDICKSTSIPPVGIMELSSMCRVLGDQVNYKTLLLLQFLLFDQRI